MADGTVGWHFFDAESDNLSEDLTPSILPGGGEGRTVIVAATPFAQEGAWAAHAVVGIARGWAQANLRIFLMDLGLDAPSLHKVLGLLNQEGVSDAFLYGASVQRIAQPALDDAIFFAPAGTATTDPEQILGHPRWNDLAGGFSEADATLLLFLPTDIAGAEKILAWATDIIFLAGKEESASEHLGPAAVKVVGAFGPAGSPTDGRGDLPGAQPSDSPKGQEVPAGEPSERKGDTGLGLDSGLSLAAGFRGGGEADGSELEGDFVFEEETDGMISGEEESKEAALSGPEIPDFGAEFAELPALEHEVETSGIEVAGDEEVMEGPAEQLLVGGDIVLETEFDPSQLLGTEADQSSQERVETEPEEDRQPVKKEKPDFRKDRPRPVSGRKPPPKRFFTPPKIAGTVALSAILIASVGTAMGSFSVPGLTWLQDLFGEVPYPTSEVSGPQPVEPILRFSLEIDAYDADELGVALEMRNTLRGRLPDLLFNLTPMETDGVVTYTLFAGPAADVVEAENLRGPLGEIFPREDPESWPIRVTPRAFLLEETETVAQAREFLLSAEADGALGYIVRVTYPDGSEGFQVLSGAFDGVQAARWWQLTLRGNGFRDLPLLERRGSSPE